MHDTQPRTPSFSSRSFSTKCANNELSNWRQKQNVCQTYIGESKIVLTTELKAFG